jgi:2,4-dienoyl-CoA reductase (NADPH2)
VDAICVNVGWHEAQVPQIVTKVPRGVFAYLARDIKARVQIPVIASHRINDPEIARFLIANEFCDMVAIGRGLIADPEFPNKVAVGRDREIIHCVACAQGCFDHLMVMKPVECLCNPRAGHEYEPLPRKTVNPKKILVAGGGAAGMAAAVAAAERGHQVLLAEQSMRLGGQLFLAGAPPGRGEFRILADDLVERVSHQKVTVQLNTRVTKEMVEREKPDVVIVACGGKPVTPPIPDVDQKHVVQAWDLLAGKATAGRNVVVIGGGSVGIETALMLAEEGTLSGEELKFLLVNSATKVEKLRDLATKGVKQIAVVEMTGTFGANFGKSTRWSMLQDLERTGIKTYPKAKVAEITGKAVRLEQDGRMFEIPADTVILAVGTRSENSLVADLKELGIACRVVGDASSPGTVFSANHQGYQAGIAID